MARYKETIENNYNILEELLDTVKRMELEIKLLKQEIRNNQQIYYPPQPFINQDKCSDGGEHEYPNPWHSILAPHCKKCGKQAPDHNITFTTNTSNPPWDFNEHGGNVMNSPTMVTHDSTKEINTNYIKG